MDFAEDGTRGVRAKWLAAALIFAACSSAVVPTTATGPTTVPSGPIVLRNQGGTLEGHTPRGFAGMGTGLFVGDNLNPSFPDGDGVQTFLTFELDGAIASVSSAVLASEVLTTRGTPFDDLGVLSVETVAYDAFGPSLFDLAAVSTAARCDRVGQSGIACDVTDTVRAALGDGEARLQFRLRFEVAGDGDGQPDLAMFFITDTNTNQPGIFTLTIDP